MKLPKLSMKKRILIAIAAIVLIHLGFKLIPRWHAMHPRVYEEAWADAMAILREEVGDEAVDKGIFTIPKVPISLPPLGAVSVGVLDDDFGRGGGLSAEFAVAGEDFAMLRFGDFTRYLCWPDGRRTLALFWYLSLVRENDGPSASHGFRFGHTVTLYDLERDGYARPSEAAARSDRDSTARRVSARAIRRFLECHRAEMESFLAADADSRRQMALETLPRMLPPRNESAERFCSHLISILETYPDKRSLRMLKKAARLDLAARTLSDLKEVPVLGRLFDDMGDYDLRQARGAVTRAEPLVGLSEDERFQFVVEGTFGTPKDRAAGQPSDLTYIWHFASNWPEEFRKMVLDIYPGLDDDTRLRLCANIMWGGKPDEAFLLLAADDPHLPTRARADCELYRLTKDRSRIARAITTLAEMDVLLSADYTLQNARFQSYTHLLNLYASDPSLGEIGAHIARTVNGFEDNDLLGFEIEGMMLDAIVSALLNAGGAENADTFMRIIRAHDAAEKSEAAAAGATPADDGRYSRGLRTIESRVSVGAGSPRRDAASVMRGINTARDAPLDEPFSSAMLEYLEANAPLLDGYACVAFAEMLAERGDDRVIPLLESALLHSGEGKGEDVGGQWGQGYRAPAAAFFIQHRLYAQGIDWTLHMKRALVMARIMNASDPVAFIRELPAADLHEAASAAGRRLARDFDEATLLSMLADESLADIRDIVYDALARCREADAEADEAP